jgi:hypothetical protein
LVWFMGQLIDEIWHAGFVGVDGGVAAGRARKTGAGWLGEGRRVARSIRRHGDNGERACGSAAGPRSRWHER